MEMHISSYNLMGSLGCADQLDLGSKGEITVEVGSQVSGNF